MAKSFYCKKGTRQLCVQNRKLIVGTASGEPGCVCGGAAPCCKFAGIQTVAGKWVNPVDVFVSSAHAAYFFKSSVGQVSAYDSSYVPIDANTQSQSFSQGFFKDSNGCVLPGESPSVTASQTIFDWFNGFSHFPIGVFIVRGSDIGRQAAQAMVVNVASPVPGPPVFGFDMGVCNPTPYYFPTGIFSGSTSASPPVYSGTAGTVSLPTTVPTVSYSFSPCGNSILFTYAYFSQNPNPNLSFNVVQMNYTVHIEWSWTGGPTCPQNRGDGSTLPGGIPKHLAEGLPCKGCGEPA